MQQVARENETGYLPPLKTQIDRIEQEFSAPIQLKGKTLIPFNTNAGYGEGSSFQTVRELCPQCTVLEGFITRGGVERDGQLLVIKEARAEQARKEVENWLQKITRRLPVRSPSPSELEVACQRDPPLPRRFSASIATPTAVSFALLRL